MACRTTQRRLDGEKEREKQGWRSQASKGEGGAVQVLRNPVVICKMAIGSVGGERGVKGAQKSETMRAASWEDRVSVWPTPLK